MSDLTPEQEKLIEEIRDEYLKIGLSCEPADFDNAIEGIKTIYKGSNLKIPKFVTMASPVGCLLAVEEVMKKEGVPTAKDLKRASQVNWEDHKGKILKWWSCYWGQFEIDWIASYVFYKKIGVKHPDGLDEKIAPWERVARSCGWWWPFDEVCFISDRPLGIHKNENGLHRDGGRAVEFRDGWGIFALNGVRVSKKIAMTPGDEMPVQWAVEESNAEIRNEIIRKIGNERLLKELNAETVEAKAINGFWYEVLLLDIGDGRKRPYLKMDNASEPGKIHIEPVRPECRTVEEAIMFRNGLRKEDIDEENGADYHQQGDTLYFPDGEKKFKLFPKSLT